MEWEFPHSLSRFFNFVTTSVFVIEKKDAAVVALHSSDGQGLIWNSDSLVMQQLDLITQIPKGMCHPLYHDNHLLPRSEELRTGINERTIFETNRAAVLSIELDSGLDLYLMAHVPSGFSESRFNSVISYLDSLSGNLIDYARRLTLGLNEVDLQTTCFWLRFIKNPAVVTYGPNCILAQNTAADRLFASTNCLKQVDNRLIFTSGVSHPVAIDEVSSSLRDIEQAFDPNKTPANSMLMQTEDGLQFYSAELPKQSPLPEWRDPIQAYFRKRIYIFSTQSIQTIDPVLIKTMTGVTLQQARVIQQIIAGKTLRQASEEIGIQYNTARNHIAMAKHRLGASTNVELATIVQDSLLKQHDF